VPVETTVFQLHPGLRRTFGDESHFDLAGMRRIRVILPALVELPREDESLGRLALARPKRR